MRQKIRTARLLLRLCLLETGDAKDGVAEADKTKPAAVTAYVCGRAEAKQEELVTHDVCSGHIAASCRTLKRGDNHLTTLMPKHPISWLRLADRNNVECCLLRLRDEAAINTSHIT